MEKLKPSRMAINNKVLNKDKAKSIGQDNRKSTQNFIHILSKFMDNR